MCIPGTPEETQKRKKLALQASKCKGIKRLMKAAYKLHAQQVYEPVEILIVIKKTGRGKPNYRYGGHGELVTKFEKHEVLMQKSDSCSYYSDKEFVQKSRIAPKVLGTYGHMDTQMDGGH